MNSYIRLSIYQAVHTNPFAQVEFIKNRFDEGAGEVVSVILLLNNQIDGDMSQCSSSASYDQVDLQQLIKRIVLIYRFCGIVIFLRFQIRASVLVVLKKRSSKFVKRNCFTIIYSWKYVIVNLNF